MSSALQRIDLACRQRGFTLVELMVTIFVLAILLAIAVPSFTHTIASTKLTGTGNDLLADVKFARTQAVSRGNAVAIAASAGDWTKGWSVVAAAVSATATPEVLRVHDAIDTNFTVDVGTATSETKTKLDFTSRGSLKEPKSGACFTLKAPPGTHNDPVHMIVRPIGTVSQFKGTVASGASVAAPATYCPS